ncbi:hypothetical protein [Klebsiella aerogenes]|uniref:hypothetical protein n=1 Tax=Klebsiella aerogenes TaxID=548 RepID=UPI001F47D4E2|nr:hypothetical protein [Klebsiella aerogenes]
MNLMTRITQSCDAISKSTLDYWVLPPRNSETTVSGALFSVRKISPDMCEDWSYRDNSDHPNTKQNGHGTYVVYYREAADDGKLKHITNGNGEPVCSLRFLLTVRQKQKRLVPAAPNMPG